MAGGDKRKAILRAAEQLFLSHRYDQVTLDRVCGKAHVGKGTIYRHFADKQDLYAQVIMSGLDELLEALQDMQRDCDEADAGEQLRAAVDNIVGAFSRRRGLFPLMHSGPLQKAALRKKLHQTWRGKQQKLADVVASVIARGMETGRYRNSLAPAVAARLLLGMVRSAMWQPDGMPAGHDLSGAVVDLFEMGLCAHR